MFSGNLDVTMVGDTSLFIGGGCMGPKELVCINLGGGLLGDQSR